MATVRRLAVGEADISVHYTMGGQANEMVCTYSQDLNNPPTQADVNAMFATWQTDINPHVSAVFTLRLVSCLYQADAFNQIRIDSTSATVVGGLSGAATTPNVTYLVRKRTAFAGKKNQGRMYIPGPIESEISQNGGVTPARVNALQTSLNTWLAAIDNLGPLIIVHSCQYNEDTEPPCVPGPSTVITSLQMDDFVATQRRRLVRS